ncbi:UNVERIFIED_CONTAM: hypothetical protein PYX00_006239 [Menopon gallinae]|uniref:Peptidase S1 domain-containing protein n=1 Tax=Menopon gallinae TaxID=328185 RepID=A0AAW2HVF3_9NEOP
MFKAIVLLFAVALASAELPTVWLEGQQPENAPKIIKGEDANDGEFPYILSLRRKGVTPGHFCGASILTSNWVLTAAHCCASIKNKAEFYAYAGSVLLNQGGSEHFVQDLYPHESYQPGQNWKNDICLIKVIQPFKFTDKVQQVALAPKGTVVNSGDKVTIAGWGYTSPNGNSQADIPNRLQKGVDFIALSERECEMVSGLKMFPGYLCARGKFNGQCTWNGDSGGPLTRQGAQVGLTSFGFRPYGGGKPTVYARVTNYIDWIKQKLGPDASQLKFKQ